MHPPLSRSTRRFAALGLGACLLVGIAAATAADRALELRIEPSAIQAPTSSNAAPPTQALPLRLVDLGGVGIPTDTAGWGGDYSHHSKAFGRLILEHAPYVDQREFQQLRRDWTDYVRRMSSYGNNGLVVPLFLELVAFDSLPRIYAGTDYAARHRLIRQRLRELFAVARHAGLDVYLATDLAPLTPPLARHLGRYGELDAADPAFWALYRTAFAEAFLEMPEVRGVVIRTGEAGQLYNRADWPYRSQHVIRSARALRTMLHQLLPVFEAARRTLILRTWSVGVGELGDLHTNPATYHRVLGDIDSPSLIVSTKFQAGDFFRQLSLNPTLLTGRHRRIVEFQARREFEAFSAFPNYVAPLHADALHRIRAANPNVVGSWLWTQNGGPLRAGPMSLYPRHGFWLWIDANVYATSQLVRTPDRSMGDLTRSWVRQEVTNDTAAVEALATLLLRSPTAVERGYYIEPFARHRVTIGGVEVPPLFWIMEWDVVGGWSSVWSAMYRVIGHDYAPAVNQGFAARAEVDSLRALLDRARPALAARPQLRHQMERSLEYEASLLTALAWYRTALLDYYRWLDTGRDSAYWAWRGALPRFREAAAEHQGSFGHDLDFPAFDFSGALRTVHLARRATDTRWIARAATLLLLIVLGAGAAASVHRRSERWETARAVWISAIAPWKLGEMRLTTRQLLASGAVLMFFLMVALGIAFCFTVPWALVAVPLAFGAFVIALKAGLTGLQRDGERDAALGAALGPLVWLALLILAVTSLRGPHHLWYLLWGDTVVRAVVITAAAAVPLWTLIALTLAGRRLTGRSRRAAVGSVVLATSAALLLLSLVAPGIERLLSALDHPLGLAPMTYAIVIGIETYTHLPAIASWYPAALLGLLLVGAALTFGITSRNGGH